MQMDAKHSLSMQNYEKTYALALQAVVGFIPTCFFLYIYLMKSDNNALLKKYSIFFCIAFGIIFFASMLIMLFKKKSYSLILKKEEIIIDNQQKKENIRSTWHTNEVSHVYSMIFPMFLRNYTRKHRKSLLVNPFYLIFVSIYIMSAILTKYIASVIYKYNFSIYNNYALVFEDGSHLNIALSRIDDINNFEEYIRISTWKNKISKKYCLTPTAII